MGLRLCLCTVSPSLSNVAKHLMKLVLDYYQNYCFLSNFEKKGDIAWILNIVLNCMVEFTNMLSFISS